MLTVELNETDLRRLEDIWPDVERAADEGAAAAVFVDRVSHALAGQRRCQQLVADLYNFSRQLAHASEPARLHQLIVSTIADHVGAQQAGLALFDDATGRLRVVATRGYPSVLVEDLRIPPGTGVIGEVFLTRTPLLVVDAARERRAPRRLRYRTGSFMAVPLFADAVGLGVLTLADRQDRQPFTRGDLTLARALAAPVALSLASARYAGKAREMAHAAAVDPLTALFNRRYFETRIDEEIQRARRYGLDLALLVIDADDFKALNDLLGHLVGDRVLKAMSDTLRRSVRAFDVCTRFGGEEFAILMPGSNGASAVQSAERIRQRIEQYRFDPLLVPPDIHPTISVGVAVLGADDSVQELIANADRALYAAKAAGKNCVKLASE
ncbi:MAG TPA: sensor domain-containing diguanylate cyclase [Vicinamibacterales bacterium]